MDINNTYNNDLACDKMINEQLRRRNITSVPVLDAMRNVPRHMFVQETQQNNAYADCPLPIGLGQTISQPYIVAFMTEQLEPAPGMKILEIGTGSGYQAAILSCLGCEVYTIELLEDLYIRARATFADLGFDAIKTKLGSGYEGWLEEAPFDAIIVTAAPESVPEALQEQLREGGRMIVPVGKAHDVQYLKLISKEDGKLIEKDLLPVRFVPMV